MNVKTGRLPTGNRRNEAFDFAIWCDEIEYAGWHVPPGSGPAPRVLIFMRCMSEKDSQIFRVGPDEANLTIAAALRRWLTGKSWSDVRRLLSSRHVTVSGNLCLDEGRRLKADE